MTEDISRREALKTAALGAAAIVTATVPTTMEASAAPIEIANPSLAPEPKRKEYNLEEMRERYQGQIDAQFSEAEETLRGGYWHVFKMRHIHKSADHLSEIALGYAITRKSVREGRADEEFWPTFLGLAGAFRSLRDADASDLFNNPFDRGLLVEGVNTHSTQRDLSQASLDEGAAKLKANYREAQMLLVGPAMKDTAEKLTSQPDAKVKKYFVWDALTNPNAWFLLTYDGLYCDERDPYEASIWVDDVTDNLLVKAYERRGFICDNPKAIYGSVPNHKPCKQAWELREKFNLHENDEWMRRIDWRILKLSELKHMPKKAVA